MNGVTNPATQPVARSTVLDSGVYMRALAARDARFDGVFFVAITSTGIYCRPVCPTRQARIDHRRFYDSAAAAERAGYRPCLRCRPELAPGLAVMDAVPRLARVAAHRIGAGALNGHAVAELAGELGVSERHLRRALEREFGVSPIELAQTHRLLLAKRLLADTSLSVTHIAFASGFQSLRRFNSVFRERYRLSPSAVRRAPRWRGVAEPEATRSADLVRLTLAYRPPFAYAQFIDLLARAALPGAEAIENGRYGRTARIDGHQGLVWVTNGWPKPHLVVEVSHALVPVVMPLIARLRQMFDLDAEPAAIDAHLAQAGLADRVARRPGMRIPGAFDGFEAVLRALLCPSPRGTARHCDLARRVVEDFGEPMDTGVPALTRLAPSAARIAEAGASRLVAIGVRASTAASLVTIARAVAGEELRLEPGADLAATRRALTEIVGDGMANAIATRALYWPDAFSPHDRALQRATGVTSAKALRALAEPWRPWRAYAAIHLRWDEQRA
jgi:AraC family transcriptional regulator of adaptative response / DNA-3-methyladenine glycosylase II